LEVDSFAPPFELDIDAPSSSGGFEKNWSKTPARAADGFAVIWQHPGRTTVSRDEIALLRVFLSS
jgi:hypothetical protein